MTERQLRDTVTSFDGTLDEVRREQAWRAIEGTIEGTIERERDARPRVDPMARKAPAARPRWPFALAAAAVVAIASAAITRGASEPARELPTVLAAGTGQRAVLERDGIVLALDGPGAVAVVDDPAGLRLDVKGGTLLATRGDSERALLVTAGESQTTSRDRVFAVRVMPGTVVFGAGEQARAIVLRHTVVLAPPPPPPIVRDEPRPAPVRGVPRPAIARRPAPPPIAVEEPPPVDEPPPAPPDARELYTRAEAALKVQDRATAKLHLARLLADHPTDELADAAHYDLALIAIAEQDPTAALGHIRWLTANARDAALRDAADKLRAKLRY